jgi:16S rRNA (adenine1518-N6/adenine1519-N6)-dimethyltransferase
MFKKEGKNHKTKKILAKKSLGQNFLQSQSALNTIVKAGELSDSDLVLEIGPGQGALTEKILQTGAKILAIEKDPDLILVLKEKFASEIQSGQLTLQNMDILEFDESQINEKYKLIANIPYYITGAIIRKFLSCDNQPELCVLLVQKEVARRIISQPELVGTDKNPKNKENLLSLSVKIYGTPHFVKKVPAGSFVPAPKVDSSIIKIDEISKTRLESAKIDEKFFFDLLHAAFAHKRKTLIKNLRTNTKYGSEIMQDIENYLKYLNIDSMVRAEDLFLQDWLDLTKFVQEIL